MHSIASVKSASGAAKYFTKDDFVSGEYYTDEKAGDVSMWGGEGATAAGLTGTVSQEAFAKALSGELPSGEKVEVRDGRRPGFDLTFSAPKSVSVMAYIARDKRILGPDGAKAVTAEGKAIAVPAMKVKPVDTVGAGDTFCGYLAAGLDAGLELEAAMRRAAVAASLACLNAGAQPAIPYAKDVAAAL